MQKKATDSLKLKAEMTYSYTILQSKAKVSKRLKKVKKLASTLLKVTVDLKLQTLLNFDLRP
ncbi:hypothetical protein NBRC111894_2811 [Sporolactobacillus inulinus]|uniref:Uncharacterized protein n=1 Tax=Sporolactobacillus inulinus TaxID=2078 RepID=A0A4Y1ZDR7_9BACL|nr:hypothetical protein NBRC111894_2811 [Sporolactobacillus inulinus]